MNKTVSPRSTTGRATARKYMRGILAGVVAMASVTPAFATVRWSGFLQVIQVQATQTGGFVVYLAGWSDSACSANPTGLYIYPSNSGVTTDGAKAMLATALAAQVSGLKVSILYDDSQTVCYASNVSIGQNS